MYQPEVYRQAAEALIAEGKLKLPRLPRLCQRAGLSRPPGCIHRRPIYDGRHPNAYLQQFRHRPSRAMSGCNERRRTQ